jgi:hypothetical protein
MMESLAYQRRAGVPVARALPLVFKAISVKVERMLDLTEAVVLAELGVIVEQLRLEEWWKFRAKGEESFTQAVGRAAYACEIQMLMTASGQSLEHGCNLVVFPDHLLRSDGMRILRKGR